MKVFNRNTKAGFTLVELIVVIAILGILAGIAIPVYSGYIKKANQAADNVLLGAVNTAFAAASVDAGQYNGKPQSASATLTDDGSIDKVTSSVDADGSLFAQYFMGNENSKFKVFTKLAYNNKTGNFKGATSTSTTTDGVTTLSYNIDGVTYNVTQDQLDAVNNSTFGQNMTMDELAGDVSGMVNALNSALGGGSLLASVLEQAGMDLAAMGINSSDENYTSELANAAVLLVAQSTTADTATNLVNALKSGDINSFMQVDQSNPAALGTLMSNMGALYGIATGFAQSDAAEDWSITIGDKTYNAPEYYDYVNGQIVAAAKTHKIDNIMNALGMLSAYVYKDPTNSSSGLTDSFAAYSTAEGDSASQLQNDANGYVNAMAAIAANADALVASGALQEGFDSGDIGAILNMIFGN